MKTKITMSKLFILASIFFAFSFNANAESCVTALATNDGVTAGGPYVTVAFPGDVTFTGSYVIMWKFRTNMAATNFVFASGVAATAYKGMACITRFGTDNSLLVPALPVAIDCHNGTTYAKDVEYPYLPNTDYYLKMEVNIPAKTFSSYVKIAGQDWVKIANNFPFRENTATTHTNYSYRSNTPATTDILLADVKQEVCDVWVGLPGTEPTALNNLSAENSTLRVYPNPTKEYIQLSLSGTMSIYDVAGKLLTEKKNVIKDDKISVSNLTRGVYFVEINDANGIHTNKFVIE